MSKTYEIPQTIMIMDSLGQTVNASVVEAAVKGILANPMSYAGARNAEISKNGSMIQGAGVAIYRTPNRVIWSESYSTQTGATQQATKMDTTTVILDHMLNLKYDVETFDMEMFQASSPDIQTSMVAAWAASAAQNFLQNLELIFLTGVVDYLIATGQYNVMSVATLDETQAKNDFKEIGKLVNLYATNITSRQVGFDPKDMTAYIAPNAYIEITTAYYAFVGDRAMDAMANGEMYKDLIWGTKVAKHMFIGNNYPAGVFNTERAYDMSKGEKVWGAFIMNDSFANPIQFQKMYQILNPDTANLRYIGKAKTSVPAGIFGENSFLMLESAPTPEQITAAQANEYSAIADKQDATFKLEDYKTLVPPAEVAKMLGAEKFTPDMRKYLVKPTGWKISTEELEAFKKAHSTPSAK